MLQTYTPIEFHVIYETIKDKWHINVGIAYDCEDTYAYTSKS